MKAIIIFSLIFNQLFFQETLKRNEIVEEVIKLIKSGLSQEVIVNYIESYNKEYEINANDLIYLKENSVPEEIIKKIFIQKSLKI